MASGFTVEEVIGMLEDSYSDVKWMKSDNSYDTDGIVDADDSSDDGTTTATGRGRGRGTATAMGEVGEVLWWDEVW